MNDLQALFNLMAAREMGERAKTQMTLGAVIERLKTLKPETQIALSEPHSNRGYYSDLALEPGTNQDAKALLADCEGALDKTFQGYKGGDFEMHCDVPVWVAFYGNCGVRLMAINDDGTLETNEEG